MELLFRTWQGEANTRADFYSFVREAEAKPPNLYYPKLAHNIKCGLGYVVATTFPTADFPANPEDGMEICELSVTNAIQYGGEFADLPMSNFVVKSYMAVGMLEDALRRANAFLDKSDAFGARGAAYCDLLKCKGDCLSQLGMNKDALLAYESALSEAKIIGHTVYEAEAALAIARLCISTYSPQPILPVNEISARIEALLERIPKEERGGPITRELQKGLKSLKNLESFQLRTREHNEGTSER